MSRNIPGEGTPVKLARSSVFVFIIAFRIRIATHDTKRGYDGGNHIDGAATAQGHILWGDA